MQRISSFDDGGFLLCIITLAGREPCDTFIDTVGDCDKKNCCLIHFESYLVWLKVTDKYTGMYALNDPQKFTESFI